MEEAGPSGSLADMGNQEGFLGFGQQSANQAAAFGRDQVFGSMGSNVQQHQQQMGGGQMGLFGGLTQHSGLQEQGSAGPFANAGMQFNPTASLQGSDMDGQPAQQQRSLAAGQGGGHSDAQAQANMWQQAFFKLAAAAGVPADAGQGPSPETIIQQAQAARHRDPWVQAQARDAAMQVQAAVLTAQNVNLRRELGSGWAAADSNIIQVQQLILDPAIEHEFHHLRAQLAARVQETEAAKAAYEGQAFTQESKNGHALLRKVKVLTDENEDLGRQQREGKQAAQAAIATVERRHADELREEVQELRDLCNLYQQENEELNMVTVLHQRQLEQLRQQIAAAQPAPAPDRDFGRDRMPPVGRDRDVRTYDRGPGDRDKDRPLAPRDRAPADRDRDRAADRPRDRTADRRGRDSDRPAPREREREYDMSRTGGGRGGRYDGRGGGRFSSRGRGRNIAQQYTGQKRQR